MGSGRTVTGTQPTSLLLDEFNNAMKTCAYSHGAALEVGEQGKEGG